MASNASTSIRIDGFPDTIAGKSRDSVATASSLCRSRIARAVEEFLKEAQLENLKLRIHCAPRDANTSGSGRGDLAAFSHDRATDGTATGTGQDHDDLPVASRAVKYKATVPLYQFDQLVAPAQLKNDLMAAIGVLHVEPQVFDKWGLRRIEPFPRTALNFQGPPGTGKTLAAHALASHLERRILVASYASIESKFHGDGPKNVEAVFYAAGRDNAVLFIDEAESLLSKRLTDATTGSESAINSMRSQLFICLQNFTGIVIFATNLVESYDKAFDTRVRHIEFPLPDEACRREIWKRHLPQELPLSADVSIERLATGGHDLCGRDIKTAVIDAAVRAALDKQESVTEAHLLAAIERVRASRPKRGEHRGRKLTPEENAELAKKIVAAGTGH